MVRELITLQFGHYANYVGAHFWNIQELSFDYTGKIQPEFNHDVLYREGSTRNNEITYTPRLLIADLKGSLKTLPQSGFLEKVEPDDESLLNNIQKIEEPAPEKNEFIKQLEGKGIANIDQNYVFEKNVNTWTDFLYSRFHHRTINIVNSYEHENDKKSFDTFPQGLNTWKGPYGEDFSDKIRQYVEECDSMQGFHISFDATDAFAALASSCTEYILDEYSKPILAHPIISSNFPDNFPVTDEETGRSNAKDSIRLMNLALMFDSISENAKLFVPLSTAESGWRKPGKKRIFHNVDYDSDLYYHSSAILASALDTLSLRYRYRNSNGYSLSDMCADMSGYGKKMAAASLGMPFPMNETEDLIDCLDKNVLPLYTSITPSCKLVNDKICQLITVRGIPEERLKRQMQDARVQINMHAYKCNSVKEMFQLYFQAECFLSLSDVSVMNSPLQVKAPYPKIFGGNLTRSGFISTYDEAETVESVPAIAGYHNGGFLSDTIERLHREAKRINIKKYPQFKQEGLEDMEFTECLDRIADFKQNYDENYEL